MSRCVGRFEIIRELGRGAQSIVYLARDPHLQRQVAIKTVHFARPDASQNRQLLAEARMVSQLRHPSIVPIFEAAEERGDLYLVFQYVPGKNLAEYLKAGGALTPSRAIAIMQPILDAITHAHAAGIIHRDLKPSNILIDDDGLPRVMDFGIAARVEVVANDGGQLTGTPAYMAPEYISQGVSSERSDIFSAGLVFYELLTGERAVPGSRRPAGDETNQQRGHPTAHRQPAACLTSAWCIFCIGRWRVIRRADTHPRRRCARRWTTTLSRKPRRRLPIPGRARLTSCCGGCGTRAISRLCRSRSGRSTGSQPRKIRAFPKSRTRSSRISR
jgi:serine/threonine protein kinase